MCSAVTPHERATSDKRRGSEAYDAGSRILYDFFFGAPHYPFASSSILKQPDPNVAGQFPEAHRPEPLVPVMGSDFEGDFPLCHQAFPRMKHPMTRVIDMRRFRGKQIQLNNLQLMPSPQRIDRRRLEIETAEMKTRNT